MKCTLDHQEELVISITERITWVTSVKYGWPTPTKEDSSPTTTPAVCPPLPQPVAAPECNTANTTAKEFVQMHGLDEYDSEARWYYPAIMRTTTMDPHAENYYCISPYAWCGNNPVKYVDPDGRDWVEHEDKEIKWRNDVTSKNHKEVLKSGERYLGEAVVVFNGSRNEKLGLDDTIEGEGAINASVVLYAHDGTKMSLVGFTMTSDAERFTPIDEGEYTATRRDYLGRNPKIPKYYQLFENGKDNIRTIDGKENSNSPNQKRENGEGYKTEIFIHRTNPSGTAGGRGGRVSVGCLLLTNTCFERFHEKMGDYPINREFKVIINRDK